MTSAGTMGAKNNKAQDLVKRLLADAPERPKRSNERSAELIEELLQLAPDLPTPHPSSDELFKKFDIPDPPTT